MAGLSTNRRKPRTPKLDYNVVLLVSDNEDKLKRSEIIEKLTTSNSKVNIIHSTCNGFEPIWKDHRGFSIECVIIVKDNKEIKQVYEKANIPVIKL